MSKLIPEKVTIGPYNITVKFKEQLYISREATGEYHPQTKEIFIDPSCVPTEQLEIFLHECIEGINSIFNLKMDHHQLSVVAVGLTQCLDEVWKDKDKIELKVGNRKKKLVIDKNKFLIR